MTVGEVLEAEKKHFKELVEILKEKNGIKRNWEYDLIMYNQVTVDKDKLEDLMRQLFDLAYLRGKGCNNFDNVRYDPNLLTQHSLW